MYFEREGVGMLKDRITIFLEQTEQVQMPLHHHGEIFSEIIF